MYVGIDFDSFYDLRVGCWNCSDSVVFVVFFSTRASVEKGYRYIYLDSCYYVSIIVYYLS